MIAKGNFLVVTQPAWVEDQEPLCVYINPAATTDRSSTGLPSVYPYKMSVNKKTVYTTSCGFLITKKYCLGVYNCPVEGCPYRSRPIADGIKDLAEA